MFEWFQALGFVGDMLIEIGMLKKVRKRLFGFMKIDVSNGMEGRNVHLGRIKK